jgi:hypothetical protein
MNCEAQMPNFPMRERVASTNIDHREFDALNMLGVVDDR